MQNDQAWFDEKQRGEQRFLTGALPEPIDAVDLLNMPDPPDWHRREMEYQYRKGFYHGMAEAADLIVRLYRGGYQRPQEIANVLGDWCNDLRRWKCDAITEEPILCDHGTPSLKWIPWPKLKELAEARDGGKCARCGSREDLEGHHVEPVNHGGLPVLKNILTLCRQCHHEKRP